MPGPMPAFELDDADPLIRALLKGESGAPAHNNGNSQALKRQAGSSGTVRGTAKVIRSLAEASKLQKGDVLVAETTVPLWSPLFATAAAY